MIFTHFGLSGPAALRCSQYVVKELKKGKSSSIKMEIDFFPNESQEALFQIVLKRMQATPKKTVKNVLKGFLSERMLHFLLERSNIDLNAESQMIAHDELRAFTRECKHFSFEVNGTLSIEKAFVTGGGVSIKEVEPKTMHSKKMHGLYFCGEVLDIHGYTGGYNITVAFSTGYTAGKSAAEQIIHS
ncbi:NAD(FAD)-utilizing dehydrogenases [Halalkalibacter hemicellulosilyticusJCM 9152]|uniref:NAD(FAD)-utilizing dehydrogenases n=2 Tax=Halalkalibacter TaxID=2893056 RepID=W4QJV3_9BACI|nr:NAD(FAD)-utilizing dehydrogenases [Halalkalibacter hemicellulosilyticusJCM 9152]